LWVVSAGFFLAFFAAVEVVVEGIGSSDELPVRPRTSSTARIATTAAATGSHAGLRGGRRRGRPRGARANGVSSDSSRGS
jgi:hypothetical protein